MPRRQPISNMQRLACTIDGIVGQLDVSQFLQLHQVQRQVGDIVVC